MLDRIVGMVGLVIVASVLMGGTFALLIEGRPVPEAVWAAWGAVITALFGHGVFLAQTQTHQQVIANLLDAVSVGAEAAMTPTNGGKTTTMTNPPSEVAAIDVSEGSDTR